MTLKERLSESTIDAMVNAMAAYLDKETGPRIFDFDNWAQLVDDDIGELLAEYAAGQREASQ